jgi:hypothetical protein
MLSDDCGNNFNRPRYRVAIVARNKEKINIYEYSVNSLTIISNLPSFDTHSNFVDMNAD